MGRRTVLVGYGGVDAGEAVEAATAERFDGGGDDVA
ncbi:MAG: hypothetical protein ACI9QA_000065 [Methanobacteriota archaeon]|jgi:hypothetical protein